MCAPSDMPLGMQEDWVLRHHTQLANVLTERTKISAIEVETMSQVGELQVLTPGASSICPRADTLITVQRWRAVE